MIPRSLLHHQRFAAGAEFTFDASGCRHKIAVNSVPTLHCSGSRASTLLFIPRSGAVIAVEHHACPLFAEQIRLEVEPQAGAESEITDRIHFAAEAGGIGSLDV